MMTNFTKLAVGCAFVAGATLNAADSFFPATLEDAWEYSKSHTWTSVRVQGRPKQDGIFATSGRHIQISGSYTIPNKIMNPFLECLASIVHDAGVTSRPGSDALASIHDAMKCLGQEKVLQKFQQFSVLQQGNRSSTKNLFLFLKDETFSCIVDRDGIGLCSDNLYQVLASCSGTQPTSPSTGRARK
jgi:hypothetical protein